MTKGRWPELGQCESYRSELLFGKALDLARASFSRTCVHCQIACDRSCLAILPWFEVGNVYGLCGLRGARSLV